MAHSLPLPCERLVQVSLVAAALLALPVIDGKVWGGGKFKDFSNLGSQVGRPLGEGQKWCAHYYGKHGGKDGWANWEESNCTFPFNDICMLVKGDAELTDHQFETRYLRSCYFRCPCNESIPWELHGIGGSLAEATNFTWNKKCSMIPPTSYALSSPNYPWPSHKVVDIYCCKKYHYPSVPADRRWLYADRGEACNMWEIDPAVRPKADATLCAALIGLVLLYLSKQPS